MIAASRDFVCIRLATYEDKEESLYLDSFNAGRAGVLENTVFCFVSPNGKDVLSRASRGPSQLFSDAEDMASYMNRLAKKYSPAAEATAILPTLKDVRLALNVAECDSRPLIVAFGDAEGVSKAKSHLAKAATSDSVRGRFVYATTHESAELKRIGLVNPEPGIYTLDPDALGLKATTMAQLPLDADSVAITKKLAQVVENLDTTTKDHRGHVRAGNRAGIRWESEIPVTDPGTVKARERRETGDSKRRRRR